MCSCTVDWKLCAPYDILPVAIAGQFSAETLKVIIYHIPLELDIHHLPLELDIYHLPLELSIYHLSLELNIYHLPLKLNIYLLPLEQDIYHLPPRAYCLLPITGYLEPNILSLFEHVLVAP